MKTKKIFFQRVATEWQNQTISWKLLLVSASIAVISFFLLIISVIAHGYGWCGESWLRLNASFRVLVWSFFVLFTVVLFSKFDRPKSWWGWISTIMAIVPAVSVWGALLLGCLHTLGIDFPIMEPLLVGCVIGFMAGLVLLFLVWLAEKLFPRLAED